MRQRKTKAKDLINSLRTIRIFREVMRQNLCEDGLVLCGEKQLLKKYKILGTEEITINVPEPEEHSIEPENIPLNIVYEDSDVIVVNKPQGLCVHPAPGNERGTLVKRSCLPLR